MREKQVEEMNPELTDLYIAMAPFPGDTLLEKVKGLVEIVGKLPKTADGVPVTNGAPVYLVMPTGRIEGLYVTDSEEAEYIGISGKISDCYSTFAAARTAQLRGKEKAT